jgi:hypothetical protein
MEGPKENTRRYTEGRRITFCVKGYFTPTLAQPWSYASWGTLFVFDSPSCEEETYFSAPSGDGKGQSGSNLSVPRGAGPS